jgi:maleate cis-trans isomerase
MGLSQDHEVGEQEQQQHYHVKRDFSNQLLDALVFGCIGLKANAVHGVEQVH